MGNLLRAIQQDNEWAEQNKIYNQGAKAEGKRIYTAVRKWVRQNEKTYGKTKVIDGDDILKYIKDLTK